MIKIIFLDYVPQTALDISDGKEVTINYDLSDSNAKDFSSVIVQAEVDICWRWDNTSSDSIDAKNDPILYKRNQVQFDVPIKLAQKNGDIYLHLKAIGTHRNERIRWSKLRE